MDENVNDTTQTNVVDMENYINDKVSKTTTKTITDQNGNTFEANIPETTAKHMEEHDQKLSGLGRFFATICTLAVVVMMTTAIVFVIDMIVYSFGWKNVLGFLVWECIGVAIPILYNVFTQKKIGCVLAIFAVICFCIGFYHIFLIFKAGWLLPRVKAHIIALFSSLLIAVISASFVE